MNTCSFMMKLIELTKPPSRSGEYHFGMLMAKKLTAFFSITQTIIDKVMIKYVISLDIDFYVFQF